MNIVISLFAWCALSLLAAWLLFGALPPDDNDQEGGR